MSRIAILVFLLFCSVATSAEERDHSEIISIHETDVEMNDAMMEANQSLDLFVNRLENPLKGDSNFSLKVMVTDENGVEHFWVSDISLTESGFEGYIANEAKTVKVVSLGQKVSFGSDIVTDWSYDHKGIKQGAFTLRVLLKRMPKEQAEYYKKAVGWD
ncbi:MAG: DUF2314 domain-containing protein [Marinobacter nauticus]